MEALRESIDFQNNLSHLKVYVYTNGDYIHVCVLFFSQTHKVYKGAVAVVTIGLIPAWFAHYCSKYYVMVSYIYSYIYSKKITVCS